MSNAIDIVAMLIQLLIYFIIVGGIFLLIRTIVLWYFRINQMAENLKTIAEAQPYILESLHKLAKTPDMPQNRQSSTVEQRNPITGR